MNHTNKHGEKNLSVQIGGGGGEVETKEKV